MFSRVACNAELVTSGEGRIPKQAPHFSAGVEKAEVRKQKPEVRRQKAKVVLLLSSYFILLPFLLGAPIAAQDDNKEQGSSEERNCLYIIRLADLREKLKEIEKFKSLNLWEEVVMAYNEILQSDSNRVVATGAGRYVSAEAFLQEELKKLPQEGKRAFRVRFDTAARRLFEKAKESLNTELLAEVVREYPLSSASNDSLCLLGDMALERGEFAKAALYYRQVLDNLGAGGGESRILTLKALAAVSGANQTEKVQELLASVKKFTDTPSGWSQATLASFLRNLPQEEANADSFEKSFPPDTWQTVGGSNTRSRNSPSAPVLGEKVWSANLFPDGRPGVRFGLGGFPVLERKVDEFNYYPAFSDGKLFCATETRLTVREAGSGRLRTERTAPGDSVQFLAPDVIVAPVFADFRADSVKLLFVNFITEVTQGEEFYGILAKAPIPRRVLFAVHSDTGKIAWAAPDDDAFKKTFADRRWSFGAPPLVLGTTVFSELKVRTQIVTSYIVAFDALRGSMKWSVPLVSNGTELTMFGFDAREPLSTMITSSEDEKTVFVCTSMGAVCALDSSTGAIKWITEYSQIPLQAARGFYTQPREINWANCPPIVAGNTLIVAPLDSRYVYAFDTGTGKVKWRAKYNDYQSNLKYVVGVFQENVILAGDQVVAVDLQSGRLRWKAFQTPALAIFGHPAIGDSLIYLPTRERILVIDAKTGELVPQEQGLADVEGYEPGNISILDDRILITGKERVTIYEGLRKP